MDSGKIQKKEFNLSIMIIQNITSAIASIALSVGTRSFAAMEKRSTVLRA